jgi:hypothetical protein
MSATNVWRHALALGVLSLGPVSCYENEESGDPTIAALFDSVRRVAMKSCACDAADPEDMAEVGCEARIERFHCVEPIVQKHSAKLAEWAECSLMAYMEIDACLDSVGCDQDAIEMCFQQGDAEDRCGDVPEEVDDAIEDEADNACPEELYCSDGTVVSGNECNDVVECPDGSDEQFCEGGMTGSAP